MLDIPLWKRVVIWGLVATLAGLWLALQLVLPWLSFDLPFLTFGRLRPLHTNAVIFAFGGCALMASSYYVVQRTSQAPLISNTLAAFTFWRIETWPSRTAGEVAGAFQEVFNFEPEVTVENRVVVEQSSP